MTFRIRNITNPSPVTYGAFYDRVFRFGGTCIFSYRYHFIHLYLHMSRIAPLARNISHRNDFISGCSNILTVFICHLFYAGTGGIVEFLRVRI